MRLFRGAMGVFRKEVVEEDVATPWPKVIRQVVKDLQSLNHSTEQDFLTIGGRLGEFIEAVNLISYKLTALADLVAEDHGLRASKALEYALHDASDATGAGTPRSGLGDMLESVDQMKRTLGGFQGSIATFHTLGVLTQIETTRLGSSGTEFGDLAEDLKALTISVQARVENALQIADALMPPIESAMREIATLEEGQAKDLPSVIAKASTSFTSFRNIQRNAQELSVGLGAQYAEVSAAFRKLIMAVQFHDITRQQIEHVTEVLEQLCSEGERRRAGAATQETAYIIALQAAQLANADDSFAASIAGVSHSLGEIARHVQKMASETRKLSGLSEDEKSSFFLEIKEGCKAILAILNQRAGADAATRTTKAGLVHTIDRMYGPIGEIQGLELQMHWLALNAGICAAHIGPAGDALSVLAASMQQLAHESNDRSAVILEALGSMSAASGSPRRKRKGAIDVVIETQDKQESETGDKQENLIEDLQVGVTELHSASEQSFAQIAEIVSSAARLESLLSETREGFSVGSVFAETVARAQEMLAQTTAGSSGSLQQGERPDDALADIAKRYTMQSERDIHFKVTGIVIAGAPTAARAHTSESGSGSSEDDSDIEFF